MKKAFLTFIILILFSSFVNASLEADWLISKSSNDKWSTIEETAYAILALKTESTKYASQISKAVQVLKTNLDTCTADNSCNIKEATLSILAMKDSITTLDNYTTWLSNSQSIQYSGELTGWKVQIISPTKSGSCLLNNIETQQYQTINVNIGYTPWADVSSTVLTSDTKTLELDCSSLQATDLTLSLIQEKLESGITYYYVKQEESGKAKITVKFGNPCWGSTSSCDKDITSLVLYTLKQTNKLKLNDPTWLKQQTLTPLQNAFLYKIAPEQKYLDAVKNSQTSVGDWNQDIYTTAMIAYLIKPNTILDKSYSWINSSENSQHCWPLLSCDVITTSAVLMSQLPTIITTTPTTPTTPTGTTEQRREACPEGDDCTILNCPGKCNSFGACSDIEGDNCPKREVITPEKECIYGDECITDVGCKGKCNLYEICEDISGDNCPFKETPITSQNQTQPKETKEEGHSTLFWFLIVLLLLIILIGGGYLAYKKGLLKFKFGKKPSKPSLPTYKPELKPKKPTGYQPLMRQSPKKSPVREHMESALERSMREMEELLKK